MNQWPFQEPKLGVPAIYKADIGPLCKGIIVEHMALYGTVPSILATLSYILGS